MRINKKTSLPFWQGAYKVIKKHILNGYFSPGERITENKLGQRLGISRTPVRESIRKLASEGLIELLPRGGARVSELNKKDVEEIYEIREVLETLAAEKAASSIKNKDIKALERLLTDSKKALADGDVFKMAEINTRFHNIINRSCRNQRLFKLIDILCTNITKHRELILSTPSARKESLRGHEAILNALRKGDGKAAGDSLWKHIIRGREILLKEIEQGKTKTSLPFRMRAPR